LHLVGWFIWIVWWCTDLQTLDKDHPYLMKDRERDWAENDLHNRWTVRESWFANHVVLSQFTGASTKKSNAGTKGTQMENQRKVKFHTPGFTSHQDPKVQTFWSYLNLLTLCCTMFTKHSTGCWYTYTAKQLILIVHIHLGVLNVGQVFSRHWNSDPTSRNPFRNFNLKWKEKKKNKDIRNTVLLTVQTNTEGTYW